ncbi:unnamed protein product [Psylliodes chrysocephalus]|uniref:Uncharacterized protein n=1 Tax=Psylliodes chrysocephalus TaxID=3402493 RepID=A0A9P0CKZ7_9CUCU|nr:unnamed protein product [Psylliodes chrysocephala]
MLGWILLVVSNIVFTSAQYEVPDAIVEAYHPKGFSVSIPDEEGIKLFAFHGKINQEMDGREAGTFSRDIVKPKNGLWTFRDTVTRLKVGDIIYFWTYVDYFDGTNKLGYPRDDQMFTVTELLKKPSGNSGNNGNNGNSGNKGNNGNKGNSGNHGNSGNIGQQQPTTASTTTSTSTTTTTTTRPPDPHSVPTEPCEETVTVINSGIRTCKGKLIFNEPFNNEVRKKYWTIENRLGGKPDYEFVLYGNRRETIFVANQSVVIKPILAESIYGPDFVNTPFNLGDECTGIKDTSDCRITPDAGFIVPPVLSSKITTKNKFSFKYGKIEVRAKLPRGDWIYPIITLTPSSEEYGPNYESGQITIAFSPGNEDSHTTVKGGVVLGAYPSARYYGIKSVSQNHGWSLAYHRFGVIWKTDNIVLTVNDKLYGTIFPPAGGFSTLATLLKLKNANRWQSGSVLAPFDKEMYISIGVGVGGFNFEDRTDGTKPWKNGERLSMKKFYEAQESWIKTWNEDSSLSVASVRVWAL